MNTRTWVMNLGGVVLAPGLIFANEKAARVENFKASDKTVPAKVVSMKTRATA